MIIYKQAGAVRKGTYAPSISQPELLHGAAKAINTDISTQMGNML